MIFDGPIKHFAPELTARFKPRTSKQMAHLKWAHFDSMSEAFESPELTLDYAKR